MNRNAPRGFTLVELLVVVVILMLAAAGAGLWFDGLRATPTPTAPEQAAGRAVVTRVPVLAQGPDGPTLYLPDGRVFTPAGTILGGPWGASIGSTTPGSDP